MIKSYKQWAFLFVFLMMGSCGKSKEEKALCQTLENMQRCGDHLNSQNLEEATKCITDEANNLKQKLDGEKVTVSYNKKQKTDSATSTYIECIEKLTRIEAQQFEFNDLKNCLDTYTNTLKNTLGCN